MENQLTNNANALRLFFTDDVFLVEDKSVEMPLVAQAEALSIPEVAVNNVAEQPVNRLDAAQEQSQLAETKVKTYIPEVENTHLVAEPMAFKYLGGNKKSVLILVNDRDNDVSTEQGRELLRKIVKAIDLATSDFALLNYAHYSGSDFDVLHQFFKPVILLSFGVEINHLKLNVTWQNEIIVHGTTRMIFAPVLHQLESDLAAKKNLWGHLQKIK